MATSDWMVLILGGDLVKPPPPDESEGVGSMAELDREFTEVALSGVSKRYILIYFAGRWCPSTQVFDPRMRNAYAELMKITDPPLELVWVSTDVSERAYKEHLKELQFLAVPWLPPKLESLIQEYEVNATPTLLVLDIADGKVLTRDGVLGIEKFMKEGSAFDAHALLEDWDEKLMRKHVAEEEGASAAEKKADGEEQAEEKSEEVVVTQDAEDGASEAVAAEPSGVVVEEVAPSAEEEGAAGP